MKQLQEGDIAPAFMELTGNKGSTVVLYFYPKDFTPGCTTEKPAAAPRPGTTGINPPGPPEPPVTTRPVPGSEGQPCPCLSAGFRGPGTPTSSVVLPGP